MKRQTGATQSIRLLDKCWVSVRFLLLGIGGTWLLFFSFFQFLDRILEQSSDFLRLSVLALLMLTGMASMLLGVGAWRRGSNDN